MTTHPHTHHSAHRVSRQAPAILLALHRHQRRTGAPVAWRPTTPSGPRTHYGKTLKKGPGLCLETPSRSLGGGRAGGSSAASSLSGEGQTARGSAREALVMAALIVGTPWLVHTLGVVWGVLR